MTTIPREPVPDSTLALLLDPYRFVADRCERHESDVFATRLMLRRALCVTGPEAARMFYDPDRFTRRGAIPVTALLLLQDRGSAATLDGAAHRHRKRMLMSLMSPQRAAVLGDLFDAEWRAAVTRWAAQPQVAIADAAPEVLCRAACAWAGAPLVDDRDAWRRTRELVAMYEGAGAVGPRNWRGVVLRALTERWARTLVERVRAGALAPPAGSALQVIAAHRDHEGRLLSVRHAAVELVNVLRPTVAIERYITFAAHALHAHPASRERIGAGDEVYLGWFVQEVRRFYPFFPLVAGRARREFEWRGHRFPAHAWVLLDVYGTNRDERTWTDADQFRPERFADWHEDPFSFVPQGGGDHHANHRCAGEWVTIELMRRAVRQLTRGMTYDVPRQDLRIDMRRMPAIPRSRMIVCNVYPVTAA